jgi:hypothetical protein
LLAFLFPRIISDGGVKGAGPASRKAHAQERIRRPVVRRALGLAVTKVDGKWRINYRGGKEATAYYTTDDDDAMGMATAMVVARGQQ